jgi:hypothetical protein
MRWDLALQRPEAPPGRLRRFAGEMGEAIALRLVASELARLPALRFVELRFSPKVAPLILERLWHKRQEVKEHADGGIMLKLRMRCSSELEGRFCAGREMWKWSRPGGCGSGCGSLGQEHARVHGGCS